MSVLLVSDTSVLIDLLRAGVLDAVFALPMQFAVPDLLYERELKNWDGLALEAKGLRVLVLEPDGVALAQTYRAREPRVSLPDAFALALAKTGGHTPLAGDGSLRAQAEAENVECHGVLWVFDALHAHGVVAAAPLGQALRQLAGHPRCRLPKQEVQKRIDALEAEAE
jgi:hypothetical protein